MFMEARDERRLFNLQAQLAAVKLLVVDELGYVPLSQTGADILLEIFSQRHERSSTIVTSNLPFEEWTSVFGNQRLTGALLDRLTHHVHILAAGTKKCGAQNPITALDGALSCAYLDAEIDRRCLARGAMLGVGPAPAHHCPKRGLT